MLPAGLNVDIDDVVNVLDDLRDVRSGGGGGFGCWSGVYIAMNGRGFDPVGSG